MCSVDTQIKEELAEEVDVQSLINNVNKGAEDVQQLLRDYIAKTKELESVVVGFKQRDDSEEKEFLRISADIAQSELHALKNMRYIEFVHDQGQIKELFVPIGETKKGGANDTQKTLKRSWYAQLIHGGPDVGFSFCDYGNSVEVLLGWRSSAQTLNLQLDLLQNDIDRSVPNLSSCVLMVNGLLCTPYALLESHELTQSEIEEIMRLDDQCISLGDIYLRWNNVILKRSRLTKELFHRNWDLLLNTSEFKSRMVGDGNDIITFVSHSRLKNSATFRGFFFSEELRGVESVGAQVNVLPSLLKSHKGKSQEYLETYVVQLFKSFCKQETHLLSQYKSAVVMLAIHDQNPLSGDDTCWKNYVVLDVRPLAPTIPFEWHFTWADVCALGQISSGGELWQTLPILKMTRIQVSLLEPYDTLSRKLFPVLNQCVHQGSNKISDDRTAKILNLGTAAAAVAVSLTSVVIAAVVVKRFIT